MKEERVTVFGLGRIGSRITRILSEDASPNLTLVNVDRTPSDTDIPGVQYICSDNITEQPLRDLVHSSDMVILITDLGSKLATEVVPIIGFLAKQSNKFSLAFGVQASLSESNSRIKRSDNTLLLVRESVDSIIAFTYDRITEVGIRKSSIKCDNERMEHEVARHIRALLELMRVEMANIDVHRLKYTLERDSYFGFANVSIEEGQVSEAVSRALSNALMRNDVRSAKKVLIYVIFDCGVSLEDGNCAFDLAEAAMGADTEIQYGWNINTKATAGDLSVFILGSGFDNWDDLEEEVLYF